MASARLFLLLLLGVDMGVVRYGGGGGGGGVKQISTFEITI